MKTWLPVATYVVLMPALSWGENSDVSRRPFDRTGQIIVVNKGIEQDAYMFRSDDDGALLHLISDNTKTTAASGDRVRIIGYIDPVFKNSPNAFVTNLELICRAPMPETTTSEWTDLDAISRQRPICLRCIIVSAVRDDLDTHWNWITFQTRHGRGHAAVTENEYPLSRLERLKDAEVEIRGFVVRAAHWRQFLGHYLLPFGKDGISVIIPPPADPFSAAPLSGKGNLHRQRIDGTVVACGRNLVFIRTDKATFPVCQTKGDIRPPVGAQVTAVGFPENGHNGLYLSESVVRQTAGCPRTFPQARTIDMNDLFASSPTREIIDHSNYSRIIRTQGLVVNATDEIRTTGLFSLKSGAHTIHVDTSVIDCTLPDDFGHGYEISVAGVCSAEFDNNPFYEFPRFSGFTIYPRVPEDLIILRRPPWWTPIRLTVVIAILLAALVAILIWNRALKVLSERRGRELAREQLRHATSELKVEERTRLAVELHDSISQTLTGVALQIDAAQGSAESPSVSGRFLDTARAMLASCRQELRCCIWDLKSRTFDESDMTEAVTRTLAPHLGETEAQVRFNVPRDILSESTAHDVLRIIRELAVNAIRHGQAKHLRIAGEYRNGLVRFSVRDDGSGFDPQDIPGPAQGHFGLQGIRERISGRNGDMTVESVPGKGTKITVAFTPDEKDEDEP